MSVEDAQDEAVDGAQDVSPVERRVLHGARVGVVDDEVWVFGGVSGPDGSTPPSTSFAPPGWTANDEVIVYDAQGAERRRIGLDGLAGHTITDGTVISDDESRYLLGNLCGGVAVLGCGKTFVPYLLRFEGSDAVPVPLQLPPADVGTDVGDGFLLVVGQTGDGLVWASQDIAHDSMLPIRQTRLLAIDITTGVGTQIDLPDGLVEQGTICSTETEIYATQAALDNDTLTGVRVMARPATTAPAEWTTVVEPGLDLSTVSRGTLECLPGGELALVVSAYPHGYVLTVSASTGSAVSERVDLPQDGGYVIGQAGERTILATRIDIDVFSLVVHEPGGPWEPSGVEISRDAVPVVINGELRDAHRVVGSTQPDRVEFPPLDV